MSLAYVLLAVVAGVVAFVAGFAWWVRSQFLRRAVVPQPRRDNTFIIFDATGEADVDIETGEVVCHDRDGSGFLALHDVVRVDLTNFRRVVADGPLQLYRINVGWLRYQDAAGNWHEPTIPLTSSKGSHE